MNDWRDDDVLAATGGLDDPGCPECRRYGGNHLPSCPHAEGGGEHHELLECTHCGGEGYCDDGSDPLGNCPDELHSCHACKGSGNRKDQVIF